ncbi:MAG: amidohydrolase [bacterium]
MDDRLQHTAVRTLFTDEEQQRLVALRREIHKHPELAFREENTAARLIDELQRLKPAWIERVAGTGVVACIKGIDSKAPSVAIRGDIDALPIEEDTPLEYTSVIPGVMHACGHDIHSAWTIGAACLLTKQRPQGNVLIVFQPAEEVAQGARRIMESGLLNNVASIFGGHVDRRYEIGQVVVQEGPIAASSDEFHIELRGQGAHGARPHESADPIVGAAALISALQTIASRRVDPASPAVVTIGTLHAGTAPNIIPNRATLSGTLRATDERTRQQIIEELQRIAIPLAKSYNLEAYIRMEEGTPPVINNAKQAEWAREAVTALLGDEGVTRLESPNLASEDFSYFLESIPGCFLRFGARAAGEFFIPVHSPKFYAAEETLFVGAAVLAETARRASAALA